jgi:hypothetical protein
VTAGTGVSIDGSGSAIDPFVISADLNLAVADNAVFDLTVVGDGSSSDPWTISVAYASTAKLDNIPDVNAASPSNGQVLAWDSATSTWHPITAPTAAPGIIQSDNSLDGDGSVGAVLRVHANGARGLVNDATNGVGIADGYINYMARRFASSGARSSADPAAVLNSLSLLNGQVGVLWYYDGTQWEAVNGVGFDVQDILLNLSGPYTPTVPIRYINKWVEDTVGPDANITILSPADLSGYSGVINAIYTSNSFNNPFIVAVHPDVDRVYARCFDPDTGNPLPSGTIVRGFCSATLY